MTIKQAIVRGAYGTMLLATGIAIGQQNIDPKLHPHLAEAQHHISMAMQQVDAAQAAWGDKLGGHAQRAKALLEQADGELKQAALYANKYK